MTITTYLLLALAGSTALLCVVFALPERLVSRPHPFVTDPFETEGEHRGRHERPDDVIGGETANLGAYARWLNKQ